MDELQFGMGRSLLYSVQKPIKALDGACWPTRGVVPRLHRADNLDPGGRHSSG